MKIQLTHVFLKKSFVVVVVKKLSLLLFIKIYKEVCFYSTFEK